MGIPDALVQSKTLNRRVSKSEYAFIMRQVKRDNYDATAEELDEMTVRFIYEINARYAIGYQLGVSGLFTYEDMQVALAEENADRARMKATGEVFYGPESFDESTFFTSQYANLDNLIVNELHSRNVGDTIQEEVRVYFEGRRERYNYLESVTYEETINGHTEVKTAGRGDLRAMGFNEDHELQPFLLEAVIGSVYEDELLDIGPRTVTLLSADIFEPTFEEASFSATNDYLYLYYIPGLIDRSIELTRLRFS